MSSVSIPKISLKDIKILGIETSCDDTGVAIVDGEGTILGNDISSNFHLHEKWGGIVPSLAAREHKRVIDDVFQSALEQSKISLKELSGIAVTVGPGLGSSLGVGVAKAKQIALEHQLPLIPVNHLEGHSLVVRINQDMRIPFPFLVLLLSGGHSQLLVCKNVGEYVQLGGTLDDSLGECFDKVGRMLGLAVKAGGQGVEQLALNGNDKAFPFSVGMKKYRNCDMSFAGVKGQMSRAVDQLLHEGKEIKGQVAADLAASFQRAAFSQVEERTRRAMEWCKEHEPGLNTLVIVGGVARNHTLRSIFSKLALQENFQTAFPEIQFCVDNGVMIAWAGLENYLLGKNLISDPRRIEAVEPIAKLPIASNSHDLFNTNYKSLTNFLKRRGLSEKHVKPKSDQLVADEMNT